MLYYFYYAIIIALFFILIYKKIKRSIGFQKYSDDIIRFRIGLVVMLGSFVLIISDFTFESILLCSFTTITGLSIAFLAKKNTIFEQELNRKNLPEEEEIEQEEETRRRRGNRRGRRGNRRRRGNRYASAS